MTQEPHESHTGEGARPYSVRVFAVTVSFATNDRPAAGHAIHGRCPNGLSHSSTFRRSGRFCSATAMVTTDSKDLFSSPTSTARQNLHRRAVFVCLVLISPDIMADRLFAMR